MIAVSEFTSVVVRLLPEPHAGLLAGILFGTKSMISGELYEALVATGTLHIAALSGMNITILESLIGGALLPVVGRRIASVVTMVFIILFVWFVGPSASVVRAAIMGSMALIAVIFGKQNWSILSYVLTVGTMLLVKPAWAGELSFQLSALATLGIILFGSRQQGNVVKDNFHLTLAAQVFTIPLILLTFHRISIVSPLTNLLIGWVIQPLTALGLIMSVVGRIFLPLAQPLAWVAWIMLEYCILAVELTAKIPMSYLAF